MSSYGDFVALSDVCDVQTAKMLAREVSDGVIAPGYTDEALEVLKTKRKGTYNIIKIDPDYKPALTETKEVFGITFEQERNEAKITAELLENRPTKNKEIPENAQRDLLIALITLKYTQSNSVCYVKDGQAIGIGAGQQSRVHCTRLAGNKADIWWLRQNPKVLALPFKENIRRPDRDNTIDVYISDDYEDVLADGVWENFFTEKPEPLTREEKKHGLPSLKAYRSAATHSSRSVTISNARSAAALNISHRQAAASVTTMLLKPAINTALPWHLPGSGCSIINLKFSKNLDNFVKSC